MTHSTLSRPDTDAAFVAGYSAYPFTFETGRRAAQLWLTAKNPPLSLAEWRDQSRLVHCARLPADPAREAAFDQAFAQELAAVIAGGADRG